MIWRSAWLICAALGLAACGSQQVVLPDLNSDEVRSGSDFLTAETRTLQDDAFANPGFLWVDRGEKLFAQAGAGSTACVACHDGDDKNLTGTAATFPKVDPKTGKLINLEGQINQCRTQRQNTEALAYESEDLLALTAYVASLSRGAKHQVETGGAAASYLAEGKRYFETRRGQFNLSCQQCHTLNWGQKLRGDTISQGHGNGFPAYRLEWQSLGSLHRRLRDCDSGVRAQPLDYGSETYIAVELYLAARAEGLELESPAVRR